MDQVFSILLQNGLPGVIIVALLYAVGKLWVANNEIQEKRIAESRDSIKAIEQNSNTLETMTEVLRDRAKQ